MSSLRRSAAVVGAYEHPGRRLPNANIWALTADVARRAIDNADCHQPSLTATSQLLAATTLARAPRSCAPTT